MLFVNGFVNQLPTPNSLCDSGKPTPECDTRCSRLAGHVAHACRADQRGERAADDQLGERVRDLAVCLQVGLDVLLHGERYVSVAEPHVSAFQSIFASRPAVA